MVVVEGAQGVTYRTWIVCLSHVRRKNRGRRTENSSCLLALLPFSSTILEPYLVTEEVFKVLALLQAIQCTSKLQVSIV